MTVMRQVTLSPSGRPARRPCSSAWRLAATAVFAAALQCAAPSLSHARPATTPPARTMYERAVSQDRALRETLAEGRAPEQPTVVDFRRVVDAYRRVVWAHPTSAYCDNALWQGAQLAIEAFDRFRLDPDRLTALTLMRTLVQEYPSSSYVGQARTTIERVDALHAVAATSIVAPPVVIQDLQRRELTDATEVVLLLDGPVSYREDRLDHPARVFLDLVGTRTTDALKDADLTFDSGLVRQIRIGRHPQSVTRMVLDTEGVAGHRVQLMSEPFRLVVTCWGAPTEPVPDETPLLAVRTPAAAPAADRPDSRAPAPPETASMAPLSSPAAPPVSPRTAGPSAAPSVSTFGPVLPAATIATPTADAVQPVAARPTSPSSNVRGGYSLARQLGLGARRIVIDAGHGGHDPGAILGTTTESAIVLDIALRLERLLAKEPGIDVVLTRREDVYVSLQERTAIANREDADLFVSIHVNASRNAAARGVETYLLDFASTPDAAAVAARENASSVMTMSHLDDLVKRIALTTKADESRDLAEHLQGMMVRRLKAHNMGLKNLGVKRAPFVVLIGASMPSVLVEVAFLTHPQEGRLLARQAYRQRIADSLLAGVRGYLNSLKNTSPVVLQRGPGLRNTPTRDGAERPPSR
jgi:N-acetylmuramoyl-L-alanine amidase